MLKHHFPDREEKVLTSLIICGKVKSQGETIRDPRRKVSLAVCPEIIEDRYVSRGGYKLEKALDDWNILPSGRVILDAGASSGGFTDCLLQRGARLVHAVDVGYNQLDYRLRRDPRVLVHERTNIMALPALDPVPDWAVMDLSFRSLRKAARHVLSLCRDNILIALIKPQFEWVDPPASFDGVIKDDSVLLSVLASLAMDLREEGVVIEDWMESPIRGTKGNREFLGWLSRNDIGPDWTEQNLGEKLIPGSKSDFGQAVP